MAGTQCAVSSGIKRKIRGKKILSLFCFNQGDSAFSVLFIRVYHEILFLKAFTDKHEIKIKLLGLSPALLGWHPRHPMVFPETPWSKLYSLGTSLRGP